MYLFAEAPDDPKTPRVQLLGSGAILREVIAAAELLSDDWNVAADVWSVTSFNELRREGLGAQRWNLLNPDQPLRSSIVERNLGARRGPVVATTDFIKAFADGIREFVPHRYKVLGTDGFGRSDTRQKLREFFEVDRHFVAVAALKALADEHEIEVSVVSDALERYGIDRKKPSPETV